MNGLVKKNKQAFVLKGVYTYKSGIQPICLGTFKFEYLSVLNDEMLEVFISGDSGASMNECIFHRKFRLEVNIVHVENYELSYLHSRANKVLKRNSSESM